MKRIVLPVLMAVGILAQVLPFLGIDPPPDGTTSESRPPGSVPSFSPRAEAYGRPYFPAMVACEVTLIAGLLALLASGIAIGLESRFGVGRKRWAVRFGFLALFYLYLVLLALPSQAAGHSHSRSFGLSALDWLGWFKVLALGSSVSMLFFMLKYTTVFCCIRAYAKHWWITATVVLFLCFDVIPEFVPNRPINPVWKTQPLPAGPHRTALEAVAAAANQQLEYLVIDHSRRATTVNLGLYGRSAHLSVIFTDTSLKTFTPRETAVLVAHELGHDKRWIFFQALGKGLGLLVLGSALFWTYRMTRGAAIPASHALQAVVVAVLGLHVLWLAASPASCALSRWEERAADRYALQLTLDHEGFQTALGKGAEVNLERPDIPWWEYYLTVGHPTLRERLGTAAACRP